MKMKVVLASFLVLFLYFAFSNAKEAGVAEKAPLFKAVNADGEMWNLEDHIGKSFIVLYFYPAAMTGGCTQQACAYRDNIEEFKALNAKVVGVSGDNVKGLQVFRDSQNLNFELLSDPDGSIARMYGAPVGQGGMIERNIGGKSVSLTRGVTISRWTYIIDKEGNIIYKNADVNAAKDAAEVLAVLKKAQKES